MDAAETDGDVFRAIADPTRRAIVAALAERALGVHEISARFPMSRPAISKHLRVLGEAGLVAYRRDGKGNLYTLNREPLEQVAAWLDRFWAGRLDLLKRLAEGDS